MSKRITSLSIFLVAIFILSAHSFGQSVPDLFKKYQDNTDFRYVSISKEMINLATLFGKEDQGNSQMISKVDEMKLLTLKSNRKSDISRTFFSDIENSITGKPAFAPLMEAREMGVHTKVLNRSLPDKKTTEILIISKSDSVQHFIWLKGKISSEELQMMIKSKN